MVNNLYENSEKLDKQRVAELLKRINQQVVTTEAPEAVLAEASVQLEKIADLLDGFPRRVRTVRRREDHDDDAEYDYGTQQSLYTPVSGACNALSPEVCYSRDGDVAFADVTYSSAFEGGPGLVHGGFIAALFDELFGVVQSASSGPSMTARLTTQYRQPVPLNTRLRFEGKVKRSEGRKTILSATLRKGDTLLAEAEALFINIEHDVYKQLSGKHE